MMRKYIYPVLTLSLLLATFISHAEENDFDKICGYFQALDKRGDIKSMTNVQRNDFILNKINQELAGNSNARAAWESIGNAIENQRYELFRSAAESVVNHKWKCEAMKKLAPITGEF